LLENSAAECRDLRMSYTHFDFSGAARQSRIIPMLQPQIIRAGRNMIANHGAQAITVAKRRAHNLLALGEWDSAETWQQIATAIAKLQGPI
jgi:hypothetical protein